VKPEETRQWSRSRVVRETGEEPFDCKESLSDTNEYCTAHNSQLHKEHLRVIKKLTK